MVTDTRSFIAVAAAVDSLHGISICLSALGEEEGSQAAAQGVLSLSRALNHPAEVCEALLASQPTYSGFTASSHVFHESNEDTVSSKKQRRW